MLNAFDVSVAQGETLAVKVCHLRPSLVWSDGEWTEWFRPGQDGTHQVLCFALSV